jgi:sugar/nucleoside kinase (ribokinase family)
MGEFDRVLLTQLEIRLETTWEALRLAKEAGVTTILNPGMTSHDL